MKQNISFKVILLPKHLSFSFSTLVYLRVITSCIDLKSSIPSTVLMLYFRYCFFCGFPAIKHTIDATEFVPWILEISNASIFVSELVSFANISNEKPSKFPISTIDFGLLESGLIRIITKTYQLLGMISFFTVGEDECRAWTIQHNTSALKAAGAIHSDIERCFIRAEVVRWNILLETRSLFVARQKGLMKLEGKNYTVQDGDTINFRHSA